MAKSFDSRLSKIEGYLRELIPDGPPHMSLKERLEFAQQLAAEILDQDSGSNKGGVSEAFR